MPPCPQHLEVDLTLRFCEGNERMLAQQLVQSRVEGMARSRRTIRRREPHTRLSLAFRLPIAIGEV
jgi:hypothetical protein